MTWAQRTRRGLLQLAKQCFTSLLSEAGSWPWYYNLVGAKAGMKLGLPASATLPLLVEVRSVMAVSLARYDDGNLQAAERLGNGQASPPATVELKGQFMSSVEVLLVYCTGILW